MAVMDEFKEERAAIKNASFKQKAAYFKSYYLWPTVGVIAAITCTISLIYAYFSWKDDAFCAVILNSTEMEPAAAYNQGFLEYAGIDTDKYNVTFDNSLTIDFDYYSDITAASMEKLGIYRATAQLDVFIAGDELFETYANGGAFNDIRNILSEEQAAEYEPYFYYVDLPVVEEIYRISANADDAVFEGEIPDPTKPGLMEEPVPVGIYVEDREAFMECYYIRKGDRVVLGVLANSTRPDTAAKYIDYLFE